MKDHERRVSQGRVIVVMTMAVLPVALMHLPAASGNSGKGGRLVPAQAIAARPLFGYNAGWGQAKLHQEALRPGDVLRVDLGPHQGWHESDRMYNEMVAADVQPLFVLHDPTKRPTGSVWSEFVYQATRRYPLAAAFEVWNEPNLPSFWQATPSPAEYARLFRLTALAADPSATLLIGGLSPTKRTGHGRRARLRIKWRSYLKSLRKRGVMSLADGVSYHIYRRHRYSAISVRKTLRQGRRVSGVRSAWITELTAPGDKPSVQARLLARSYRTAIRKDAKLVLIHTLVDTFVGAPYFNHAGVLRSDGTPKPAFHRLQSIRATTLARSRRDK